MMIDGWTADNLISREALKKAIDEAYEEYDGYDPHDLCRFAERVDEEIDNAPTIPLRLMTESYHLGYELAETKFKRPQGKWIEAGYEIGALRITYRQTQCSNCGWEHALATLWNYCPNCGADMKGE